MENLFMENRNFEDENPSMPDLQVAAAAAIVPVGKIIGEAAVGGVVSLALTSASGCSGGE